MMVEIFKAIQAPADRFAAQYAEAMARCVGTIFVAVTADGIREVSPAEYLRSPGDGEATEGEVHGTP
jgi:hypothetical protein